MREVHVDNIKETVEKLCIDANYNLGSDVKDRLVLAKKKETFAIAQDILGSIIENAEIAEAERVPMCQDTGMACVFVELGQEVHIVGGGLHKAINDGVRDGYAKGFLRKSVVKDPIRRINTGDNTPAVIYVDLVEGDKFSITVAPKGFGSENMSALAMLKPSDGLDGVKKFIIDTVRKAGPNACPPMIVGVGIGGTFDKAANLAKRAAVRSADVRNGDEYYKDLELELLEEINTLGIGPQGFGGRTTALAINIEVYPTHIAGLPVAVNINCHATRHLTAEL